MSHYFDNKGGTFLEPNVTQYGSHMIMTNVQKPTKLKYLNIDTRFSDDLNENTTANYLMTLPQRINDVKTISVRNIEIPMTFYNISINQRNNIFKMTDESTNEERLVILQDGHYDADKLKMAINLEIQGLGLPFSNITYDIVDGFSVFFYNDDESLPLEDRPDIVIDFDVKINGETDADFFKFKLGWLVGYRCPSYVLVRSSYISSKSLIHLDSIRYLYLVVDEFGKGTQNTFVSTMDASLINKNILARITLNSALYGVGTILPANQYNGYLLSDKRSYTGKVDLQRMNVQIVNEIGVPINLNGQDFSFCLELEYE